MLKYQGWNEDAAAKCQIHSVRWKVILLTRPWDLLIRYREASCVFNNRFIYFLYSDTHLVFLEIPGFLNLAQM